MITIYDFGKGVLEVRPSDSQIFSQGIVVKECELPWSLANALGFLRFCEIGFAQPEIGARVSENEFRIESNYLGVISQPTWLSA